MVEGGQIFLGVVPPTRLPNRDAFAVGSLVTGISFKEVVSFLAGGGYHFAYFRGEFFSFPVVLSSVCSDAGNAQSLTRLSKDLHREHWRGLGRSTEEPRTVAYKVVSTSLRRAPLS